MIMKKYPDVLDKEMVGQYSSLTKSGGGFVWDEVLEYRVWCHPENGAEDLYEGDDYYYCFESYYDAFDYSNNNPGCEEPLALILQREYIDESAAGQYVHVKKERITEWPVEFLTRPKRTKDTIPDFLSPTAPANKLDILRGLA
jgi:hypothetical protein